MLLQLSKAKRDVFPISRSSNIQLNDRLGPVAQRTGAYATNQSVKTLFTQNQPKREELSPPETGKS